MAAPNIVGVTTIYGRTNVANVTTVSTNVVVNEASSGQVFKINSLYVSNVDGANTADITVEYFKGSTGDSRDIAKTITVPADATLVVVSKDAAIYLEEGDYLRLQASANNDLEGIISYEVIS